MCGSRAVALAFAAALVLLVIYGVSRRERFFTAHGAEEPTRSHTPYTGTLPFGPWGSRPWAEAATDGPHRCPPPRVAGF